MSPWTGKGECDAGPASARSDPIRKNDSRRTTENRRTGNSRPSPRFPRVPRETARGEANLYTESLPEHAGHGAKSNKVPPRVEYFQGLEAVEACFSKPWKALRRRTLPRFALQARPAAVVCATWVSRGARTRKAQVSIAFRQQLSVRLDEDEATVAADKRLNCLSAAVVCATYSF